MTLTDRDRKILIFLVPVVVLAAYWFLALAPKRGDASKLGAQLTKETERRDKAEAELRELEAAKRSFDEDYATLVRLGKAIPTSVDMPSLIVQLQRASKGSGIDFERIKVGERLPAEKGGGKSSPSGGSGGSAPAAAPGGEGAGTSMGRAAEKAGETKQSEDARSAAAEGSGGAPPPAGGSGSSPGGAAGSSGPAGGGSGGATGGSTGTGGTTGAGGGSAPAGGGAGGTNATSGIPGLDAVPLEFTFAGSFFELTDLFHSLKRFVRVSQRELAIRGRLMTISGFTFKATDFPKLEAQVQAMVYLTPREEGQTAGATPSGPPSSSGGSGSPTSAPASAPPAAVAAP